MNSETAQYLPKSRNRQDWGQSYGGLSFWSQNMCEGQATGAEAESQGLDRDPWHPASPREQEGSCVSENCSQTQPNANAKASWFVEYKASAWSCYTLLELVSGSL